MKSVAPALLIGLLLATGCVRQYTVEAGAIERARAEKRDFVPAARQDGTPTQLRVSTVLERSTDTADSTDAADTDPHIYDVYDRPASVRTGGALTVGLGGALAIGGGLMLALGEPAADSSDSDSDKSLRTTGAALAITGGVAIVAGAVTLLVAEFLTGPEPWRF